MNAFAKPRPLAALITLLLATATPALAGDFVADGKLLLDVRLRAERIDDDAFAKDADALTLRTRLGWKSGSVAGFSLLVEAEDVRALNEDYNSTANGRSQYPTVADPEGSEWNQAYLGWDSGHGTQLALGRQRILLDNQRFVGNVGWRQNEQTYDALTLNQTLGAHGVLHYAYLDQVNRVFGNVNPNPLLAEWDLDAHLVNVGWTLPIGTLSGYGYFIDNQDLPASSTRSLGARLAGARAHDTGEWLYAVEYARQQGWRDAPDSGSVDYRLLQLGCRWHGHALRLTDEQLGSNGERAFQTPLATGHAFDGWADRFLTTPANGVDDRYLSLDGPLGRFGYVVAWHDFQAARGGADYGTELDAQIGWPFAKGWNALAKLADYRSDGFGADVRKVWLSVEYKY